MILVVGATGYLGEKVAERLLLSGEPVRALVRTGATTDVLAAAGAEIVQGDLRDPASLNVACRGVRMVVTTANSAARTGADTLEAVDLKGNESLIAAALAGGAEKFVFVSAFGASQDSPIPFFRAKALTEQRILDSGMDHAIIAPDLFAEIWIPLVVGARIAAGEPVTLVGDATRRHSFISVEDAAAFTVAMARSAGVTGGRFEIGGPEALSWRDIVAIYERVLGRGIDTHIVEPGSTLPGLPEPVAALLAAMATYDSVIDSRALSQEMGVTQTRIEDVIRNQLIGA